MTIGASSSSSLQADFNWRQSCLLRPVERNFNWKGILSPPYLSLVLEASLFPLFGDVLYFLVTSCKAFFCQNVLQHQGLKVGLDLAFVWADVELCEKVSSSSVCPSSHSFLERAPQETASYESFCHSSTWSSFCTGWVFKIFIEVFVCFACL